MWLLHFWPQHLKKEYKKTFGDELYLPQYIRAGENLAEVCFLFFSQPNSPVMCSFIILIARSPTQTYISDVTY